jgi:hypothetical protein
MSMLQRYKAWNLRREQRSLESWALERAKGKTRFVLQQAFTFTVFMAAYSDVVNHLDGRSDDIFKFWTYMGLYAVGGLFVGSMAWESREGKYQKAQLNGRLQKPFDDRLVPH